MKDAGPWITKVPLSYTVLIDDEHLVSKLYNMVNVPTGVWIDEQGHIVRPNEVAFVDDRYRNLTGLDSTPYLNALRDWAEKGSKSQYVMSEDKLEARLAPPDPAISQAAAEFGLGEQLYKAGHLAEAIPHFKEAQRLNPQSWNYKRQAWALSDSKRDYGTSFGEEVQKIGGGRKYYAVPDIPGAQPPAPESPEKKP